MKEKGGERALVKTYQTVHLEWCILFYANYNA